MKRKRIDSSSHVAKCEEGIVIELLGIENEERKAKVRELKSLHKCSNRNEPKKERKKKRRWNQNKSWHYNWKKDTSVENHRGEFYEEEDWQTQKLTTK